MKFLLLFTLLTQLLLAAPAFNGKRTFIQPDGETIEYRLQGDEYLYWLETDNGSLMLYNKKSKQLESMIIENGTLKPSGKAIHETSKQSSQNMAVKSSQIDTNNMVTKAMLLELQQEKRLNRHLKIKKSPTHKHDFH